MLGTQIPFVQGFGASYFHVWHKSLGTQLVELSLEGFQVGHEDAFDISRQSVFFNYRPYFVGQFWTSHRIIHCQAHFGFSTTGCPPIPSCLVSKATSLSQHLVEQGI